MLRIFLVSSHFSAILQSIYASSTKQEGDVDVIMIDYPPQKKTLSELILKTNVLHTWDKQLNYAPELTDATNMRPSFSKKLTRKTKQWPLFKTIYALLHKRYLNKFFKKFELQIEADLNSIKKDKIALHLLTKTGLNDVLIKLFPTAEINYFEHGIGDYMYYEQNKIPTGNFYCIFHREFAAYLKNIQHPNFELVKGFLSGDFFHRAVQQLEQNKIISNDFEKTQANKRYVFILIESVEIYQVPDNFWVNCMDIYLKKINMPDSYIYVLKPHPLQSFEAISTIENYFKGKGLETIMLNNNKFINIGAELIFSFFFEKTDYVFSLFSSSIYYFTKLFPSNTINYYQGYELFKEYTLNAPKQFTDIYEGLEPIITKVLATNCKKLIE
jgi:hypothetical protein